MNAQQNGYKIIEKRYLKTLHSEHYFSKIEYLSTNLPKHRQENFTGSMLLHHTLNSTKYLSRWIEAKNK
jgi:hypothetical protein